MEVEGRRCSQVHGVGGYPARTYQGRLVSFVARVQRRLIEIRAVKRQLIRVVCAVVFEVVVP